LNRNLGKADEAGGNPTAHYHPQKTKNNTSAPCGRRGESIQKKTEHIVKLTYARVR